MADKMVLAIVHRLVVLDQGRIVEDHSPDALIAKGRLYAQLWKL